MKALLGLALLVTLSAPLAADTSTQRKNERKAAAAKAAPEQKRQHRETMKAHRDAAKAAKNPAKRHSA